MSEFNYENIFMGVMAERPKNYKRTFRDDYRLKRLTELLKMKKGRILDIGCGGGITTESLPYYYPSLRYFGCDVSRRAIDYARKFGSGKVKYDVIKNKRFPYKNNFFDACICLDVMEHVPDVDFFLKEVKRVLKKRGKFFLLVPCEGQPFTHTWFWQKIGIGKNMTFNRYGHIHPEFTHSYVENLLQKNGFKIEKRRYSEHLLFQLISVIAYFIPLEILHKTLGKRANLYTDSGVIRHKKANDNKDLMILIRNLWYGITNFLRTISGWEIDLMKKQKFGAWKLIVLAESKKK